MNSSQLIEIKPFSRKLSAGSFFMFDISRPILYNATTSDGI